MFRNRQVIKDKFLKLSSVLSYSILLTALIFSTMPIETEAHPGPTDEYGCHRDHNSRYHCH